jgi:hypothetical protein
VSAVWLCLNCRCQQVAKGKPKNCIQCEAGPVWLSEQVSVPELFAGATEARAVAMAQSEGEKLAAKMREPVADISKEAGRIERESPLFFGTGDNPTLF